MVIICACMCTYVCAYLRAVTTFSALSLEEGRHPNAFFFLVCRHVCVCV